MEVNAVETVCQYNWKPIISIYLGVQGDLKLWESWAYFLHTTIGSCNNVIIQIPYECSCYSSRKQ